MDQIRIGKAKNQGKPGDTIAVEINGKKVQKKAGNEINSTKVVVVGDTVLSGSSPVEKRSQTNIKRKRKKKKASSVKHFIKILAVVENLETGFYEFWVYGDRKNPIKAYEISNNFYLEEAAIWNKGDKETDWEIFIKWYDSGLEIETPQPIRELDPTVPVTGQQGAWKGALVTPSQIVLINEYARYLEYSGGYLTIPPESYISQFVGVLNIDVWNAQEKQDTQIYEWPTHGDTALEGDDLDFWIINDLLLPTKVIPPVPPITLEPNYLPLSLANTLSFLNPFSNGSDFQVTVEESSFNSFANSFALRSVTGSIGDFEQFQNYLKYDYLSDDFSDEIHDFVPSRLSSFYDLIFDTTNEIKNPDRIQLPYSNVISRRVESLDIGIDIPYFNQNESTGLVLTTDDRWPITFGASNSCLHNFIVTKQIESWLGFVLFDINFFESIPLSLDSAGFSIDIDLNKNGIKTFKRVTFYDRTEINEIAQFWSVEKAFLFESLIFSSINSGVIGNSYWVNIDIPFLLIKGSSSFILGRYYGKYVVETVGGQIEDSRTYSYSLFELTDDEVKETVISDFGLLEYGGKLNISSNYFSLEGNKLIEVVADSKLEQSLAVKVKVSVKSYLINEGVIEEPSIKSHEVLPFKKLGSIWSANFSR